MILLIVIWTNFGYNVLLYLAGMSAIDPSLEEAARIDGARLDAHARLVVVAEPAARDRDRARREHDHRLRLHVHVRLHDHERRARATDTYVSEFYIYQQAFTNQNMGYAAAVGVMLVGIVFVIGLFQIRAS